MLYNLHAMGRAHRGDNGWDMLGHHPRGRAHTRAGKIHHGILQNGIWGVRLRCRNPIEREVTSGGE